MVSTGTGQVLHRTGTRGARLGGSGPPAATALPVAGRGSPGPAGLCPRLERRHRSLRVRVLMSIITLEKILVSIR